VEKFHKANLGETCAKTKAKSETSTEKNTRTTVDGFKTSRKHRYLK